MKLVKTFISTCRNRNSIIINNNNIMCGKIYYKNENNVTTISNLYVDSLYRNNGYATELLKTVERSGLNERLTKYSHLITPVIHEFNLCAWEPTDKPHLIPFYEKRGYTIDPNQITSYYDDGDRIFELIKMTKKIILIPPFKN